MKRGGWARIGKVFASLRGRYFLVVVGIATIPLLVLGFVVGLRSADELERQSLVLQTEMATRVEREIATFISLRINELRMLEQTNVLSGMEDGELLASLSRLLAHDQVFQELVVLDAVGKPRVFASRTDISSENRSNRLEAPLAKHEYWTQADTFLGRITYDAELREPLLNIAIPILKRRTGEPENVLVANVRFKPIWDLLADLELPADAEAFVVGETGRILAHRSPAEVLSGRIYELPSVNGVYPLVDGRDGLVVTRPLLLVSESAHVVISRPLDSALANAFEIRRTTLITAFALLVAASFLALHQSASIVRPVEHLARVAKRIAGGDLEAEVEVSGPREINALSQAFQDMTERLKGTISDLSRSEFAERQRAMITLESIGDAVITTDQEGVVTYLNPVAETLTGWPLEEAKGLAISKVFRIVNENTRAEASNPVARCLESGKIVGVANDTALISRDGREFLISDSAAPIREANGEVIGAVMVFSDDTERKEMEQSLRQSQKMEAIGKLSGGIAHDFNNLMQVIQGNAELLNDDPSLDTSLTAPILRATERGAELTKRLLAFARKQPLQSRPVDVADLLADILPMLDRTLGEKIDVSMKIESRVWAAKVDPGQLETALLNVILNARDAMPNGGKLEIGYANATTNDFQTGPEVDLDETEFVSIFVSDSGVGMSGETHKHAIEPFYSTKGVGEGSGLGLSMVYGFVVQSGGHLEIDTKEGAGTTISMFLPRSRETTSVAPDRDTKKPMKGQEGTILIIEDEAEVRELARKIVVDLGYRVFDVENLTDARKVLSEQQFVDLVLSDVVLRSGESGLDFAFEVNATHPDLPVVLMSGYPDKIAADKELNRQGYTFLSKPFQRAALASTIQRLLD